VRTTIATMMLVVLVVACRGEGGAPRPTPGPVRAAAPDAEVGGDSSRPSALPVAPGPRPASPPPGSATLAPVPAALAAKLKLTKVMVGLRRPVLVVAAPGDRERLYVVEQLGSIRVFEHGGLRKERFFDMLGKVSTGNEQGLLGLAFHPRFADNGKLYVNYTDRDGDTHIVEFRVTADRSRVDPSTRRELIKIDQPYSNHNGGHLLFGKDGKLYAGMGDGGSAGDPKGNGQNRQALLAKLLRFSVDEVGGTGGDGGVAPEIVHWGLRNPWRFAFDAVTGDLFIGDVGQSRFEYVHVIGGDDPRGHNFGWNIVEGNHCYDASTCDRRGLTPPAVEYAHAEGCSVTGGVVYRGKALPELDGVYFYADYCTSLLRSFRWSRDASDTKGGSGAAPGYVRDHWDWRAALDREGRLSQISSFGSDADGELYIVSLTGVVWKLERA
jgi:glucose/arabinose dehydrogenase